MFIYRALVVAGSGIAFRPPSKEALNGIGDYMHTTDWEVILRTHLHPTTLDVTSCQDWLKLARIIVETIRIALWIVY